MSNYYAKRDAKVRMAHELMNRGWEVLGYHADESDSMTDYYSPAYWGGIATKNGFVLVVDNNSVAESTPIKKYNPEACLSYEDQEKIKKLEALTQDRGATAGEEANAKALIEKIKLNTKDVEPYTIVGYTVAHMANPGKCKWHIEKDGAIYDKGTGITKYSDMPEEYRFNINTMQYEDSYKYYSTWENGEYVRKENTITDEERKIINDFKALILRWERVVNSMNGMGDGTKETEEAAKEQLHNEKMEKVIVKETKKVLKMVEVKRDYFQEGDYITVAHHGHYWKITREYMQQGTWKGIKESRKAFVYEIVGSASRGYQSLKNPKSYYNYEYAMLKNLEEGKTKIFELKEVEEVTEVEKWVRKTTNKNTTKKETAKAEVKENISTVSANNKLNNTMENSATRRQLWALHCATKLDTTNLIISKDQASELIGKSKNGDDITNAVKKLLGLEVEDDFSSNEILENENVNITITDEEQQTAEALLDYSTTIMKDLGLNYKTYTDSQEYKNRLIEIIKKHNFKLTKGVVQYLHEDYELFEKVLKDLLKNNTEEIKNSKTDHNTTNFIDYTKLLEKVNNQIESNNKNIEKYSGDYKTNTWKRMKEQEGRDLKIKGFKYDNSILKYIKMKIEDHTITALEQLLITKSFRENIDQYYNRVYVWTNTNKTEVEFPKYRPEWGEDNWYNKETKAKINRLNKANIFNTSDLLKVVDEYKIIMDSINNNNTIDLQAEKIKKLEREYRMQQKGDVNFTSKNVVEQLLEYADIKEGERILEPNAGIGNIADMVKEYTNNIDVCEYAYSYAELLKMKGYNVLCNDFMECKNYNTYDKIIMNPPFSNNQDITHVKHAFECLKSSGRLVAITSNHWSFANDKASIEFREWLNSLDHEVYDLPSGSFEFTNVACKILIINKDEQYNKKAM